MLLLKIMLLSFDDAKVRRFLQPSKKYYLLSSKKCLSFDVCQAVVCEHSRIVCENTFILHFLKEVYINKKIRMRFLTSLTCFLVGADGFEPPKSKDSRFTVCPIWPLWKTPIFKTGCKGTTFFSFPQIFSGKFSIIVVLYLGLWDKTSLTVARCYMAVVASIDESLKALE